MSVLSRHLDGDAKSVGVIATEHWPPPRRWQRVVFAQFAACAAATAVIGLSMYLAADDSQTTSDPAVPPATSASDVRLRVSTALSSMRTLRGEIFIECAVGTAACPTSSGERTTRRWSFVTDAAGDERVTGIDHQVDFAYSATQREQRSVLDGPTPNAKVVSNLAPAPGNGMTSVLHGDVAPLVRAFLATAEEVRVSDVIEGDQPAWRLAIAVVPTSGNGPGTGADQLEVVVDKQSGFPLRITETFAGQFRRDVRLSSLVVDGPVDPASFTFELPAGVKNYPGDAGFTAVALGGVEAVVGYRPLLPAPASLPAGYTRAEVTVALDIGVQNGNPPSQHVVAVAYRRGFDRIVVTTRSTGTATVCPSTGKRCWTDLVGRGEGVYDPYERFTVGGGALVGAQAALAMSPRGEPHVWTIDDRLVVTVAGDASAKELQYMVESFTEASA